MTLTAEQIQEINNMLMTKENIRFSCIRNKFKYENIDELRAIFDKFIADNNPIVGIYSITAHYNNEVFKLSNITRKTKTSYMVKQFTFRWRNAGGYYSNSGFSYQLCLNPAPYRVSKQIILDDMNAA